MYLGRDTALDRPVALKFISSPDPSPAARSRFLVEARAIAKLTHPNVVGVYRVGEVDGHPYIAYEFVAGQSLDKIQKPVAWETALRLGLGLARGLAAAHATGILHRDIKPGNAVLGERGEIKLLDFGLAKLLDNDSPSDEVAPLSVRGRPETERAKEEGSISTSSTERVRIVPHGLSPKLDSMHERNLTRPGTLMGTPAYLSPELWWGEAASPRSDVFALGLVLYELIAGKLPHAHLEGEEMAFAIIDRDVPSLQASCPAVPESLAKIVDRCLRREATERFPSAVELEKALAEVEAVFLPATSRLGAVEMEPSRLAVAASMARLSSRMQSLTTRLYDKLFEADPTLRALFPEDLETQKSKLAHALRLAIDGLAAPSQLVPVLEDLGRRHVRYGVQPEHFLTLGKALVGALAELDANDWTPELESAWGRAYSFIEAAMRRGMAAERETVGSASAFVRPRLRRPSAPPSSGEIPRTRYAQSGDLSIAYQVFGEGPIDLVFMLGWISHVEIAWQHPLLASFLRSLGQFARVIVFDKRGTGMSDRAFDSATLEDRVDDLKAVLDHVGSKNAVIFGVSEAVGTATMMAVMHPSRVRGLVLYGGAPRLLSSPDYPLGMPSAFVDEFIGQIRARWGDPVFVELEAPSMADDQVFRDWLGLLMRMSASPGTAIAMLRLNAAIDIRDVLPLVRVPTLVLHRQHDRISPLHGGEWIAKAVPGARLKVLAGEDHLPFVGDAESVLAELQGFVTTLEEPPSRNEALVAVLTLTLDGEMSLPLAFIETCAHYAKKFAGTPAQSDALTLSFAFDGAVRAVRCAHELLELAERENISVRAGLDAGRCEGQARGLDVAIASASKLAASAPLFGAHLSPLLHELAMGSNLPTERVAETGVFVLRSAS